MLIALSSDVIALPVFPMLQIPKLLLYLIGNTLTQYICISAVFILTTECASLTVTLVVTLRKVRIMNLFSACKTQMCSYFSPGKITSVFFLF